MSSSEFEKASSEGIFVQKIDVKPNVKKVMKQAPLGIYCNFRAFVFIHRDN